MAVLLSCAFQSSSEAEGFIPRLDDISPVCNAVNQRFAESGVGNHLCPLGEGQVCSQNVGGLLGSLGDDLEQELGADIQTMDHLLSAVTLNRRIETWLLAWFAFAALFFSALGLFGVASLSAARRTREFGIRLAVGANATQIVSLELSRTARIVFAGILCGVAASVLVARAMQSLLYGTAPLSAEVFLSAAGVLLIAAFLAAWIPARRAGHIDPASALRAE